MWKSKDFRTSKTEAIGIVKRDLAKGRELQEVVSDTTIAYGIPLVVLYEFVAEDMVEYRKECFEKIQELNKFYGIKGGPSMCDFCEVPCFEAHCVSRRDDE